jgi:hypothetical protein
MTSVPSSSTDGFDEEAKVQTQMLLDPIHSGASNILYSTHDVYDESGLSVVDSSDVFRGKENNNSVPDSVYGSGANVNHNNFWNDLRNHPYAHFYWLAGNRTLFGREIPDYMQPKNWSTSVTWLLVTMMMVFLTSLGSTIALWILVQSDSPNEFNVQTKWTTDFLQSTGYPAAPFDLSYIRIAYFFAAGFTAICVVSAAILFLPHGFFGWYIKRQVRWRKDEAGTLSRGIAIFFVVIGLAGALGMTNIFVILFWSVSVMIIIMNTQYIPEKHYGGSAETLNILVPVMRDNGNGFTTDDTRKLSDNLAHNNAGKLINDHMGFNRITLKYFSRTLAAFAFEGRAIMQTPIKTYKQAEDKEYVFLDLATHASFILNPHLWIALFTTFLTLMTIIVPISYYGGALHNSGDIFSRYVHAAFWLWFFAFYFNLIWNVLYWSVYNYRGVPHPEAPSNPDMERTELLVGGVAHITFSWWYWMIFLIAITFTLLGGLANHPTDHLY